MPLPFLGEVTLLQMTIREAISIQQAQLEHYCKLSVEPDAEKKQQALREWTKRSTFVAGQDETTKRELDEINKRVPRGGHLEWLYYALIGRNWQGHPISERGLRGLCEWGSSRSLMLSH
jgi:hypothetical protein